MTEPQWLSNARSYIGFHEQPGNHGIQQFVSMAHCGADGESWCSIFANAMLESSGFPGTRSAMARSFESNPNFVRLDTPRLGCIVTYWRGSPSSGEGHVDFWTGTDSQGRILGLGGNQSDAVNIEPQNPEHVTGYWWPAAQQAQPSEQLANSGRGSWFSQFSGKYQWVDSGDRPGSAALGCPDDAQGIALYDRASLGRWFTVRAPNGTTSIEQQTDIGPHPNTGRLIDISAAAAERFGYSPHNFPTDSTFAWQSIAAPASIASLSPQQQAVAYRDLRGKIMTDTATQTAPAPITDPASPFHFDLQALISYITAHPVEAQQMVAFQVAALNAIHPGLIAQPSAVSAPIVAAPPAPTPALQRPSVQASIGALAVSVLGMVTHLIGLPEIAGLVPPEAATHVGTLSTVIPLLTGAVGASGGFASLLKVAAKIFAFIPK